MKWPMVILYLYITYRTFRLALNIWKEGNKSGSVFVALLSLSYPVLVFWLFLYR